MRLGNYPIYKNCEVLLRANSEFQQQPFESLQKNLFAFPSESFEGVPENVCVCTPENPYDEITEVAYKIKKMVCEENIRYKDISVICSDISSYSHIFRSVFNTFDIPYFIDEKTPVLKHSIVFYVVSILDVYINSY